MAHEVILRIDHEVLGDAGGECEVQPFVLAHIVVIDQTRHEHGCKERAGDTNDERRGKSTDRTCAEEEQDDTREDGGQVGVEDGREGILITALQGVFHIFAETEFFFRAFVYQHIGVNGHTQREHHTGDAAHGQRGLE